MVSKAKSIKVGLVRRPEEGKCLIWNQGSKAERKQTPLSFAKAE